MRDFKALVQGGDEVVFYFSGHGVQFGGSNYLIPIDITADSEAQVADDAIPLQRTLHGKLVNGEIVGTWYDQFQSGEFHWTVRAN